MGEVQITSQDYDIVCEIHTYTEAQTPMHIYLFIYFIYFIFIYFWLHWVFVAAHGLSLVAASEGYSLLCAGFSLRWLLLRREHGL